MRELVQRLIVEHLAWLTRIRRDCIDTQFREPCPGDRDEIRLYANATPGFT
jgi:hypothetical protein